MNLEFRALRHFVALAEELHFGRAAQKLGMTQPPLSQSIKRLEKEIGLQLVERTSRTVSLTRSGEIFAAEASRILQQLEFTERRVKQAAAGEVATLTIGFIAPALYRFLPIALDLLRARMPRLEVHFEELPSEEQIKLLHSGRIDLAMISPAPMNLRGLAVRPIEKSGTVLAVPIDWPFADRTEVQLAELKDYPFILTPFDRAPAIRSAFFNSCSNAGFIPKVIQEATQTNIRLSFVSAGIGAAIVTATAQYTQYQGVRFLKITDLVDEALKWELSIVWQPRGVSTALRTLIECCSKASGDLEQRPARIIPND